MLGSQMDGLSNTGHYITRSHFFHFCSCMAKTSGQGFTHRRGNVGGKSHGSGEGGVEGGDTCSADGVHKTPIHRLEVSGLAEDVNENKHIIHT